MKKYIITICTVLCLITFSASAKNVTDSIKVLGNCESCKSRIEKAAKEAGALSAVWNEDSQMLQFTYDDITSSKLKIEKQIAAVGHDTPDVKATTEAYNSLHSCCQYKRTSLGSEKVVGNK